MGWYFSYEKGAQRIVAKFLFFTEVGFQFAILNIL